MNEDVQVEGSFDSPTHSKHDTMSCAAISNGGKKRKALSPIARYGNKNMENSGEIKQHHSPQKKLLINEQSSPLTGHDEHEHFAPAQVMVRCICFLLFGDIAI